MGSAKSRYPGGPEAEAFEIQAKAAALTQADTLRTDARQFRRLAGENLRRASQIEHEFGIEHPCHFHHVRGCDLCATQLDRRSEQ